MRVDNFTRFVLAVIALSLAIIAARPLVTPPVARAQANSYDLFIEPGTTILRAPDGSMQVTGKVVVDLKTGNIWGFPTLRDVPYPSDATKNTAPVSHPIYLGKYNFAGMTK